MKRLWHYFFTRNAWLCNVLSIHIITANSLFCHSLVGYHRRRLPLHRYPVPPTDPLVSSSYFHSRTNERCYSVSVDIFAVVAWLSGTSDFVLLFSWWTWTVEHGHCEGLPLSLRGDCRWMNVLNILFYVEFFCPLTVFIAWNIFHFYRMIQNRWTKLCKYYSMK